MHRPHNQERIVSMYQMLFEMARGNFSSRIPLSSHDDELETLVVLINMVAEEMKEAIFYQGYVNNHISEQFVAQSTLILDSGFVIQSFTADIIDFIGYTEAELLNSSLASIVTADSMNRIQNAIEGTASVTQALTLDFITKEQLLFSVSCGIGILAQRAEIVLNFLTAVRKDFFDALSSDKDQDKSTKIRKSDALLIQKLYDYILAHLDDPLPSLKDLSRVFGTNEHKLKDGFRFYFNNSIYQFYNEARLKRARYMITHTALPLKRICVMNGFNNYPNFSKSFKKHFGHSPNEVVRDAGSFELETDVTPTIFE